MLPDEASCEPGDNLYTDSLAAVDLDSGDSRVPRVAGQQEAHLRRTMLEFKNKVRLNAAAKTSLTGSFDDAAIGDLAHFLATM